jgi:hypothetical protein
MIRGEEPVNDGNCRIAIDPLGYTFFVYPEVTEGWVLSLTWDGLKLDFQDGEETPFTEEAAGAVAEYVKAKIAREVDRDIGLHDSYMRSFQGRTRMAWVNHLTKKEVTA